MPHKSDPNCPFCKIVSGEYPSKKVYEDDKVMCVLDINPATKGHCLLFPKNHHFILPQLPPDEFRHISYAAWKLSKAVRSAMFASKSTIFVANGGAAGQQVGHFMMHIFPESLPNHDLTKSGLVDEKTYASIKQNLNSLMHSHGQKNGKNMASVQTEKLYEFEDLSAEVPSKVATKGHVMTKGKKPVDFFYLCNYASSAAFELLGAQGSNIIVEDTDAGMKGHVIPRVSNDGLNFMWQPSKMDEHTLAALQSAINFKVLGEKFQEPEEKPFVNESTVKGNFIAEKLRKGN
jgi:histidine triad (HIT) family protein